MTAKHFKEAARRLKDDPESPEPLKLLIAFWLSDFFATFNPRFDKDKFLKAAGLEGVLAKIAKEGRSLAQ